MPTKGWVRAAVVPLTLLGLCSSAAAIDCTNLTVTCNTLTKGTTKFKPVLSNASAPGTCTTSVPANLEVISIKGTLSDCTVSNPAVKIVSGAVKGTIYTGDCSCASLVSPSNPVVTPPPGKFNSLVTTWKFDSSGTLCDSGQVKSTFALAPGVAAITQTVFSPGPPFFNPTAIYGLFSLGPPGVGVSGIFQGGDLGTTSFTSGTTTESAVTLLTTCGSSKGLKGFTFGQANSVLQ